MATDKSAKERFYQYCVVGDLNGIKTDLFYNVSPFSSLDKVTSLFLIINYYYFQTYI